MPDDPQSLPDVVLDGWTSTASGQRLQSALTMWHQGMLLHQRHATMASIAFCSGLETFGSALLSDPEALEDRRAAYAAAVDTWGDPEDRGPLDELFGYWKRSRTVHNARTWADESMFGTLMDLGSDTLFGPEPHEGGFGVRAVGALRRASRTALLSAVKAANGADS